MVDVLEPFAGVRATFNLVPSLLVQLQAFSDGRARDRHLTVGLAPAEALGAQDRAFLVANGFHAAYHRMIAPFPRYQELHGTRGIGRDVAGRGRARPAGLAQARLDGSRLAGARSAAAGAARQGPWVLRGRQAGAARRRAGAPPVDARRLSAGLESGAGGAVHLAVLSPDPAAAVRHRRAPGRPPSGDAAAASLPPADRRARAGGAGGALPYADLRRGRRWECGPRKGRVSEPGRAHCRGRRAALAGDRRGRAGPLARRAPAAGSRGPAAQTGRSVSALRGANAAGPGRGCCSATTCCRTGSASSISRGTRGTPPTTSCGGFAKARRRFARAGAGRSHRSSPSSWTARTRGSTTSAAGRPFLRELYGRLETAPDIRTVTMATAADGPARPLDAAVPGIVDSRGLLHLGGPPRRPAGLVAAGQAREVFDERAPFVPAGGS